MSFETNTVQKNPALVRQMFEKIASRYDRANTILSFGTHYLWKRKLVANLGTFNSDPRNILDCATGTGDVAHLCKLRFPSSRVVASDFCPAMMEESTYPDLTFTAADASRLPFKSDSFDAVTISFGIRNVQNIHAAIQEFSRVLRPGGTLAILEFGQPSLPLWRGLYRFYSLYFLPRIGGLITGERSAYHYLEQTSEKFPSGRAFCDLVETSSQFTKRKCCSLFGGIAYLYFFQRD